MSSCDVWRKLLLNEPTEANLIKYEKCVHDKQQIERLDKDVLRCDRDLNYKRKRSCHC
jgi:hypothetical protein